MGSFTNYVDNILVFFDHLPPCVDNLYVMNVDKNGHFKTTYLPRLINVVCERPLYVFAKSTRYFLRVRKQYCDAVEILLFHRGLRYVDLFKKARNSKSLKLSGIDC